MNMNLVGFGIVLLIGYVVGVKFPQLGQKIGLH